MPTELTQAEFLYQVAEEATQRGFDLLEEKWPGFYLAIDTTKLAILDGSKCVLGQLSSWTSLPKWALDFPTLQDALNDMYEAGEIGKKDSEFASFEAASKDLESEVCVADWDVARNYLGLSRCAPGWYGFDNVIPHHHPCRCGSPYGEPPLKVAERYHTRVPIDVMDNAWVELITEAQQRVMARDAPELVSA